MATILEWVTFRALCDSNDTWIVVDGQRITRDMGGQVLSYLRSITARQESDEKAHRTRSGLREAARQGRYPVGQPPYGYRSVGTKRERRFVVEPAEAVVVRRIFEEYVSGIGVNRIAARLNDEGIRTRAGGQLQRAFHPGGAAQPHLPRRDLSQGRGAGHRGALNESSRRNCSPGPSDCAPPRSRGPTVAPAGLPSGTFWTGCSTAPTVTECWHAAGVTPSTTRARGSTPTATATAPDANRRAGGRDAAPPLPDPTLR